MSVLEEGMTGDEIDVEEIILFVYYKNMQWYGRKKEKKRN
jgi:hypothetical protein